MVDDKQFGPAKAIEKSHAVTSDIAGFFVCVTGFRRVVLAKSCAIAFAALKHGGINPTGVRYISNAGSLDGFDRGTVYIDPTALERKDWSDFAKRISVVNRTLGTLRVIFL